MNEVRSKLGYYRLYSIIYSPIELGIGAAFWDDKCEGSRYVLPLVQRVDRSCDVRFVVG